MRKKFYRGMALLLAVLFFVPLHGFSMVSSASDEAQVFEGHRYQVFDESMTWTEAKAYCEELGGHLATVTSQEENDFIASLIADGTKNLYWLGGYEEAEQEGVWRWVTGEAWDYANWDAGEPNDAGSESYVEMFRIKDRSFHTPEKWNDMKNDGEDSNVFYAIQNKGLVCEWDTTEIKKFPEGYNFNEDSYGFGNDNRKIEWAIFSMVYGDLKGTKLWMNAEKNGAHGLCYGMAATTAALLKYSSAISSYKLVGEGITEDAQMLRQLSRDTFSSLFNMTAQTYIKFGQVYQYDADEATARNNTRDDMEGLYQAVVDYVNGAGDPIVINFHSEEMSHALFIIGVEQDAQEIRIILNDSNSAFDMQYMKIAKDFSSWSYSGAGSYFDSTSSYFDYCFPADMVYSIGRVYGEEVSTRTLKENGYLSNDNLLLTSNHAIETSSELIDISDSIGAVDSDGASTQKVYWLEDNANTIDLTTEAEASELTLSDVNSAITLQAPANSKVAMTVDDDAQNALTLTSRVGEAVSVDFMYARDDDISTVTITGTTASETVTAEETDSGLVVTGLNDMTVTLETADGSAETAAQVTDGATVQITVDEENTTVSTDWTCSHPDANHDGICDNCGEDFTVSCSHFCHSDNKFVQFIWKILNFFYRLFGIDDMRICSCGKYHW